MSYVVRPAYLEDTYHVYALMNREDVCMWSTDSMPKTWDMHEAWFDRYVGNKLGLMFLLEHDGVVKGEVHYDPCETDGKIGAGSHIALQPEMRGQGIGRWLLESTIPCAYDVKGVKFLLATIRPKNVDSVECFSSCGFEYLSTKGNGDNAMACYIHEGV